MKEGERFVLEDGTSGVITDLIEDSFGDVVVAIARLDEPINGQRWMSMDLREIEIEPVIYQ